MSINKKQPGKLKSLGNEITELHYFRKLNDFDESAAKDRLRGFFGNLHGDWAKANEQADTSVTLLNALSLRQVDFKSAYKAEQSLQEQNSVSNEMAYEA